MVAETFGAFRSIEHTLVKAHELSDVLIYEAVVVYTCEHGQKAEIPYADFLDFEGELVKAISDLPVIYLDL